MSASLTNEGTGVLRERAAAALLGVSHRTLQRWRCTGEGPPFVRCGIRAVGYLREDLEVWIQNRRHQSTSQYKEDA